MKEEAQGYARMLTLTHGKIDTKVESNNVKLERQQLKLLKWILKQKVNLEYYIMFINSAKV